MINVLIFGGSGKIGLEIENRKNIFFRKTYFKNTLKNGIKFDILNDQIENIEHVRSYDCFIIMSAISEPEQCFLNEKLSKQINVIKTKELISHLKKYEKKIIFFSTEYIYDGLTGNYNEDSDPNPVNLYGSQKLEVENYIKRNIQNHCILRIAKTYSSKVGNSSLVSNWYNQVLIQNIKTLKIASDQFFSPLFANDIEKVLEQIINKNFIGTINLGGPDKLSRMDYFKIFISKIKKKDIRIRKVKLSNFTKNEKLPLVTTFNTSKLKNFINFKMTNFENGVKKFLENVN